MNGSIKKYVITAIMAGVICALAPISIVIPISPVPITLATFAIYISIYILGMKYGTISVCIYILLGAVGIPVYNGWTAGADKIIGPTGGYIIGYIFLAIVSGHIIEKDYKNGYRTIIGFVVGTIVLYTIGTTWLAFLLKVDFVKALFMGVVPFIIGDIIKIAVAFVVGKNIREILLKNNIWN